MCILSIRNGARPDTSMYIQYANLQLVLTVGFITVMRDNFPLDFSLTDPQARHLSKSVVAVFAEVSMPRDCARLATSTRNLKESYDDDDVSI